MLLITFLLIFTIIGIIIYKCDTDYWHTDGLEVTGILFGFLSGFATTLAIIILIVNLCGAPASQVSYEEKYNKLVQKVEHIDSFNCAEIVDEVNKWNEKYRENTYARKSPWIGWYYVIDTSTTNLIELENSNDQKYR